MKIPCLLLGLLVLITIMAICVMVKFSTDVKDDKKLDLLYETQEPTQQERRRSLGVINLATNETKSVKTANRFPYTAAILRNTSQTWTIACFASVILVKWLVMSAHCRKAGSTHRVLVYHDYVYNYSRTYPILFWRIHEHFNKTIGSPKRDIAIAKLNIQDQLPYTIKSAVVSDGLVEEGGLVASVWKTVASMDGKQFLTNDFDQYNITIAQKHRCYESYGVVLDKSMFCVDMSAYNDDCFVNDFGPLYYKDRIIGVSAIRPRECDSKLAIFTNVSWYAKWILKSTGTADV